MKGSHHADGLMSVKRFRCSGNAMSSNKNLDLIRARDFPRKSGGYKAGISG